ncbi:MAG: ABC transporter permease [Thermoplasmatota archaeon]
MSGFLVVLLAWPLAALALRGFAHGGWDDARAALARPYIRGRFVFSFEEAVFSTIATLAVGLPAAWALARGSFRGKSLLRAWLTLPFVLPAIVVALALLAALGPDALPPLGFILVAHAFYNVALVVRLVGAAWERLDPRYREAARVLGASPFRAFLTVEAPLLGPAIAAAAILTFLFAFTSFGIVLIFGGIESATVEVAIYTFARELDLGAAAALALLQMLVTAAAVAVYAWLERRSSVPYSIVAPAASRRVRGVPGAAHGATALALFPATLLVSVPLLALVARSFRLGGAWTFANYAALGANTHNVAEFATPALAVWNSLRFAVAAALLAVPLGYAAARALERRGLWADALLMLPLGASAATLGVGFLLAFSVPPLDLRLSVLLIVLAHVLVAYPFTARAALTSARATSPRFEEVAATLGAGRFARWWRVALPLLEPGLIVGATFAFAVSIGEFAATSVLYRPEWTTLPLLLYRTLARPGAANLGEAEALAVILLALVGLGFLVLEQVRTRDAGES